jgi:acyl dehydratase
VLHWEDFTPGHVAEYGPRLVTREEIVAFAAEFDPQPFHLDEEAGRASLLGGLAASGWHTCCLFMRIVVDGFLRDAASMGGPGVESVRWHVPLRPGDTLTVRATVLEARPSKSRPDMGFVKFLFEVINQTGTRVMTLTSPLMLRRREAAAGQPS